MNWKNRLHMTPSQLHMIFTVGLKRKPRPEAFFFPSTTDVWRVGLYLCSELILTREKVQGCKIERRNTSKRGNEPCPIPARPKGALGQEMWRILMKPFSLPEQWPGNVCVWLAVVSVRRQARWTLLQASPLLILSLSCELRSWKPSDPRPRVLNGNCGVGDEVESCRRGSVHLIKLKAASSGNLTSLSTPVWNRASQQR